MKVYVASKFERKAQVREAIRQLRLAGHTVVGDWTQHTVEGEGKEAAWAMLVAFAKEDRDAVLAADALLLIHDDNCRGGFVELGLAIAARLLPWSSRVEQRILVVGAGDAAPTLGPIFYFLPEVEHYATVEAAVEALR